MATKYFCDVCGHETRNPNELNRITRDFKTDCVLSSDICRECADKIFKPVKEWHSMITIELTAGETP